MPAKDRIREYFLKYLKYFLLALLMYMPLFGHLDGLPLRDHDEGLNSINAYEMYRNGDWIVMHHNFNPDMYNTKPPLLMWTQVFFMKLIGVNDLAVRLPSAFAGFFTCIALLVFCKRCFNSEWPGIFSVLALITTNGYIHSHVVRTADFDAMLTLFTTVSSLFFFAYCETLRTRWLYLFFICLALAVLTKGIAGLLFGPALLFYAIFRRRVMTLLKNKHFYAGLFIFLFLAVGYYLLRESRNPGYIAQVQMNEIGGRYLDNPGNKPNDFWFYYKKLVEFQVADRYLLIPCGLLLGLFSRDLRARRFSVFSGIIMITHFIIISSAQTRLEQYVAPLFPFMAVMVAFVVYFIFRWLRESPWIQQQQVNNVVPYLAVAVILWLPYKHIWEKTYSPAETYSWDKDFYEIGHFYKDALRGKIDLNGKRLLYDGWNPHILFYVYALQEKGIKTDMPFNPAELKPGDEVVVYQEKMKRMLRERFECVETTARGNVSYFRLVRRT